jgi:hypothetical protein
MSMRVSAIVAAAVLAAAPMVLSADEAGHIASGTVDAVDSAAKTVTVKTADGVKHTAKITDDTMMTGGKDVASATTASAKAAALATKKGSQAVVSYTAEGGKETAHGIKVVGHESVKAVSGTVTAVDHAAGTVAVKTADGAVATYHLASDGVVETGKGTAVAGKDAAHGVEVGSKVTVHYTVKGGESVIHGIDHLL